MDLQQNTKLTLADVQNGERCMILKVHGHGGFRHRILELGFVRGEMVTVLKNAPLLDPVEYEIMGTHVSLRRKEASLIEVVSLNAKDHPDATDFHGTIEEHVRKEVEALGKEITVALVGNPNCGKTSLFNYATGLREKVGNYSGVTVDSKTGTFYHRGYTINLVDLPGTYSLTEYSPEELYVRDYLDKHTPDIVLNIVNAGNLERNLFLTTQLIDRNHPMVMALNMYDELKKSGDKLDHQALSHLLGFPIVPVIARSGWGLENVLEAIVQVYEGSDHEHEHCVRHIHINYGQEMEEAIRAIRNLLVENKDASTYHPRYVALKLIEQDQTVTQEISQLPNGQAITELAQQYAQRFEKEHKDNISSIISDLKFGFIRGALSETYITNQKQQKQNLGYALDKVLTNKYLGFPILFVFLFLMFEIAFVLGAYPQDWIGMGIDALCEWLKNLLPAGALTDLLVDGVLVGVGSVLEFVPQIMILFFFISILEDTGYMARAAFIMDKLMHKMGLHGKSFIPYIIGFGCSVPAILAARTLENKRDRILTIITIPFISCSARLPVYLILIGLFFAHYQALMLLGIYIIGLIIAIFTSLVVGKLVFKKQENPFVIELPPYRIPTLRNASIHMWDKAKEWLKRVSTIVVLASVIIWGLGYFPHHAELEPQEQMEQSYLGKLGHAVEPVFEPLGFDWRTDVSLIAGCAAKEVIASTMAILYQGEENITLSQTAAFSLMLFILLYFPCIGTLATIRKEIGYKWVWFSLFYNTGLAWFASFVFYQIASRL